MRIGYARVSTQDQDSAAQVAKLTAAGCERIFTEKESGGRWERPELQKMLELLRAGDVVVVTKLDRLSRSLKDLLFTLERWAAAGVEFECLDDRIETASPAGKLMLQMIRAFAEFERSLIRQRTGEGMQRARAEGRVGGRKSKLSAGQRQHALAQLREGRSQSELARLFNVDRATICRLARELDVEAVA
jgi:DNA invertase Pin-like site-specific DNA recombinase